MKEKLLKLKDCGLFLIIVMLLCSFFGVCDGSVMSADVIAPERGGAVDTNAATTVSSTRENSENLILDDLYKEVTKIRPHDVPLATIGRTIDDRRIVGDGTKDARGQVVRHYAISTIELSATLTKAIVDDDSTQTVLETSDKDIFACDQTILVNEVDGYLPNGAVDTLRPLMLYVISKDASGHPIVIPVNGKPASGGNGTTLPSIPSGTKLTRAGRAGSETQIQTDAYSAVPTDFEQYLQKFMAQVEVSTLYEKVDKEVKWNIDDQQEEAFFDMKRTMNVSFWRGVKWKIRVKNNYSKKAEDIYFTEGIWTQAGKEFSFSGIGVTADSLVTLMKHAFTGNNSGQTKTFIVGSDLLEALEKVEYTKVVYVGSKRQSHGIEYSTIISKFGTLLLAHDQTLDDQGMADKGFILDVDFLRLWTHGLRVTNWNFDELSISDSKGRGLMEICGLVLRNPDAHSRVLLN